MNKSVCLIILDGWGFGQIPEADAIFQANTPFFDSLLQTYPNSRLITHGQSVGLPEGQMGNSEVGHLNIGAGRIVYQDFSRIENNIREGSLRKNKQLISLAEYCLQNRKPCHLIGMVSDGGVHSHTRHLKALVDEFEHFGMDSIYLHLITDGRDTDPHVGLSVIQELEEFLKTKKSKISTVIGRYYAMDRDHRWERTQKAYDLMVNGNGELFEFAHQAIEKSYADGVSDEFILPNKIGNSSKGLIQDGDAVLCFNFRTDRLRQLTQALSQGGNYGSISMKSLSLNFVTMTRYDASFKNISVLFETENLSNTLGECLSVYGLSQLRIAETEKYPHVSFFFSGGREKSFVGEKRILIPSPKVATYDLKPEMSAIEVTNEMIKEIVERHPDFICLNFANTDMVGHTGNFTAVVKAAETVDHSLEKIVSTGLECSYQFIIIADHGNADYMINEDGSPNTAHTKNPVPCIVIGAEGTNTLKDGILADIAPSILDMLSLPAPVEMTGVSLLNKD